MRLPRFAVVVLLPLLATCWEAVTNLTSISPPHDFPKAQSFTVLAAAGDPATEETYFQKCACRGRKLTQACKLDKDKAV